LARLAFHQHGADQHEVAEFRMNEIAVNPHVAESCRDRDGLVRHDPDGSGVRLVHLHRKAHRGINGADSAFFEFGNDRRGDVVHFVPRTMKFQVRHRTGSGANRFPGHPYDETQ
jgi:hypothetical protein